MTVVLMRKLFIFVTVFFSLLITLGDVRNTFVFVENVCLDSCSVEPAEKYCNLCKQFLEVFGLQNCLVMPSNPKILLETLKNGFTYPQ